MTLTLARATVFCRDLDASLAFYRDVIGLVAVEEKTIQGAAAGALLQLPPCRLRIALLAPSPAADVMLGVFEIGDVAIERLTPPAGRPAYGQTAVVFQTDAFDTIRARAQAAQARFLTPPLVYPKRHASERSPAGLYREMILYDPDEVLISVMQIDPLPPEER